MGILDHSLARYEPYDDWHLIYYRHRAATLINYKPLYCFITIIFISLVEKVVKFYRNFQKHILEAHPSESAISA